MTPSQRARLAQIEAQIARNRHTAEVRAKPVEEMTEIEVIEEWRRLTRGPVPPRAWRPPDPPEVEQAIIEQWQQLKARRP
jgi:hypothetical protein